MFFPAELCENWLSGFIVIQLKKQTNLLTYSSYTPPTTRYFLVAIARRAVFKGEGVSGISPLKIFDMNFLALTCFRYCF